MVFLFPTGETEAAAVIRTRSPSVCGAEPSALQRSAVKRVRAGGRQSSTLIVREAVAVLPRESVTVTDMS